ncbi:hypothetical protein RA997_22790, partial [Mycobacteroides abscessus subsp. abscessus]|uniref:hypothetical protein n=1 Tax=Mycobacteroides abscessus TaxID=36809 RepID=UPI003CF68317
LRAGGTAIPARTVLMRAMTVAFPAVLTALVSVHVPVEPWMPARAEHLDLLAPLQRGDELVELRTQARGLGLRVG